MSELKHYSISQVYNKLLLEMILKKFISEGVIPSANDLVVELTRITDNQNLDFPMTTSEFFFKRLEESSAEKMSELYRTLYYDLYALLVANVEANKTIIDYKNLADFFEKRAIYILSTVGSYLKNHGQFENLKKKETISEDFSNFNQIDQNNTTALVDVEAQQVTAEPTKLLNKTYLLNSDSLTANCVTKNQLMVFQNYTYEELTKTQQPNIYVAKCLNSEYPVDLELVVKQDDPHGVVNYLNLHTSANTKIGVFVSNDGFAYTPILDMYSDTGVFSSSLPGFLARFVKIAITKTRFDEFDPSNGGLFLYNFLIRHLELRFSNFNYVSTLQTKPLYTMDGPVYPYVFDKLHLEIEAEIPEKTEIQCYVSTDKDSLNVPSGFGFSLITPGEDFYLNSLDEVDDEGVAVDVGSLLDTSARLNYTLDELWLPDSVRVWRNVGQPASVRITNIGEETGWRKDGNYYRCVFRIDTPDGVTVDFGPNDASIDNEVVSGLTFITNGEHTFKTHEKNWQDVRPSYTEKSDPLYPYNHKLIIEGHPLIPVYAGVDFYAAYELKYVDLFDFQKNVHFSDFGKFTIDYNSRSLYVKISEVELLECSQNVSDALVGRELYRVFYKKKRSDSIVDNTDRCILRFVLKTRDDKVTPVLKGYSLQLAR